MIRRIQALDCRCLRYADGRLDRFHVLGGPNAGGKGAVFDVAAFPGGALLQRTADFHTWLQRVEA